MSIVRPHLGSLPAPAWHRPFLRYFAPVEGEGGGPVETPPAEEPAPASAPNPAEEKPVEDTPPWKAEDFDQERAWRKIQAQKADLDAERAKRDKAVQDAEAAAAQRAKEEAYREFGKQLGVVKDDEPPTVDGLTSALQAKDSTLTAAQAENLALRTENAVLRHADALGADAGILLRLEDVKAALATLDPTADNYASEVERTVKEAVEQNPFARKVQVAPRSSNGNPAPSGGTSADPDDIDSLRASYRKSRGQD
jgi:hypothetical protein